MFFNERYSLEEVRSMADELIDAYYDGLPYPLLKLLEYFSLSQGAFAWGKQYRNAGYFTSALVW
jgi:dual oxidase maturation factor 1